MTYLTNPSLYYERWRGQPVQIVRRLDGGYVDVRLVGDLDYGLCLRVSVSAA